MKELLHVTCIDAASTRAALHEAMLGAIIDQRVSVSESPEDKRDRRLQRALCASAIRLAAETEMTNVALKPSCRDSGTTRIESANQSRSLQREAGGGGSEC